MRVQKKPQNDIDAPWQLGETAAVNGTVQTNKNRN
jgi:hypothetical protein